jgi:exodeoxyribonuclease-1
MMADSFFFYDLETSGFDSRGARIMQFAGRRTDMDLEPIGDPVNVLIKLTPDVLPSPDAILVTGITPQMTISEGVTEAEFLELFYKEVVKPGTIFLGFNSIRFDDEFMRFLHYRNFYDAYEWQWKDGNSRWDLLDVVRMTRALRPEGIEWPFAPDGKPANRLEFLTAVNKLGHDKAHDALSDVNATIAVAKLVKTKQPELFEYLLRGRNKNVVKELVLKAAPFVYTSGRYSSEWLHTTVAVLLDKHAEQDAAHVYDLRFDPTPYLEMSVDQLAEAWKWDPDREEPRLPVKTVKYNRSPAVAPLGVIKDQSAQDRIKLSLGTVAKHYEILKKHRAEFAKKIHQVVSKLDDDRVAGQLTLVEDEATVDHRLYDGFINKGDAAAMRQVRGAKPDEISQLAGKFQDKRLQGLLPLYKARNYPGSLNDEERKAWEEFTHKQLLAGGTGSRLAKYFNRLQELAADSKLTAQQQYLLEELQLYGESIVPADAPA